MNASRGIKKEVLVHKIVFNCEILVVEWFRKGMIQRIDLEERFNLRRS